VVTPLHRQDRELTKVAGSPKAWSKWTPHEAAFNQGKLSGGNGYTPEARFMAGQRYAEVWDAAQSAGRDSTQAQNISRGFGGGSISQAQSDAIKALVAIDSHMGQRDRIIIRMVCGEGYFPSEAVRLACGDYKDTVSARYREALDALVDAVEEARKVPGRVRV
jgi:hypothetical protein